MNTPGPAFAKYRLSRILAELREQAGLTTEVAAKSAGWPAGRLAGIESGQWPQVVLADVRTLLDVYDAGSAAREAAEETAARCQAPQWWRAYPEVFSDSEYPGFEDEATAIRGFSPVRIPVQLQTETYTRAMARADHQPPRTAEAVQRRKAVLTREDAPFYSAVITEAAIRYRLGNLHDRRTAALQIEDQREQVLHLAEMNKRDNVEIRICTFDDGIAPGLCNTVSVLRFGDGAGSEELVWADTAEASELVTRPEVIASHLAAVGRVAEWALEPGDTTVFLERFAARLR